MEEKKNQLQNDDKRLYFFQFKNTFFDERITNEITMLARDNNDNENDYLIMYLKMITASLATDGYLVNEFGNPFTPSSLRRALKFYTGRSKQEDFALVDRIITAFEEANIIKILSTKEIYIPSVAFLVRSMKEESERVENWRRKKAILDQEILLGKMMLDDSDFETIFFQCFTQLVLMGYTTKQEVDKYKPVIQDLFNNYKNDVIEAMFIFAKKQIDLSKIHEPVNYFHDVMKKIITKNIPAKRFAKSKEELIEEELEEEKIIKSVKII